MSHGGLAFCPPGINELSSSCGAGFKDFGRWDSRHTFIEDSGHSHLARCYLLRNLLLRDASLLFGLCCSKVEGCDMENPSAGQRLRSGRQGLGHFEFRRHAFLQRRLIPDTPIAFEDLALTSTSTWVYTSTPGRIDCPTAALCDLYRLKSSLHDLPGNWRLPSHTGHDTRTRAHLDQRHRHKDVNRHQGYCRHQ